MGGGAFSTGLRRGFCPGLQGRKLPRKVADGRKKDSVARLYRQLIDMNKEAELLNRRMAKFKPDSRRQTEEQPRGEWNSHLHQLVQSRCDRCERAWDRKGG